MFCISEDLLIWVREGRVFVDEVDDVEMEVVNVVVELEVYNIMDGSMNSRIFLVEVGLFFVEGVEVVFFCSFVLFLCVIFMIVSYFYLVFI